MKVNKLVVLLMGFIAGCGGYAYQPPAPVYEGSVTDPYRREIERSRSQIKPYRAPDHEIVTEAIQSPTTPDLSAIPEPTYQQPKLSPAVVALMSESERNSRAGDLESAVVVMERALRLDSRNPLLTYKLAELRLRQEKPRLAEDLAKKAGLLAAGDNVLKRKSWLLISRARQIQRNYQGAKEAKIKADSFGNP